MSIGENSQFVVFVLLNIALIGAIISMACIVLVTVAFRSILKEMTEGNRLLKGIEARLSEIARAISQPKAIETTRTKSKRSDL
jgi:hypothetical protein